MLTFLSCFAAIVIKCADKATDMFRATQKDFAKRENFLSVLGECVQSGRQEGMEFSFD